MSLAAHSDESCGLSLAPRRFDNLIQRFEEPSSMVRWDSPLFALPWDEPDIPLEELWLAATQGTLKPPNTATIAVSRPLSWCLRRCLYSSHPPGTPAPLGLLAHPHQDDHDPHHGRARAPRHLAGKHDVPHPRARPLYPAHRAEPPAKPHAHARRAAAPQAAVRGDAAQGAQSRRIRGRRRRLDRAECGRRICALPRRVVGVVGLKTRIRQ